MAYKEKQSLNDYVNMFEEIYEPIQNLERSFYQVFARLIESIAQCSQFVNKQDQKRLADNVPEVFSWYCSLVHKAKLKISLSEAIWKKFPYVCPYCLTAPCTCVRGKKSLEDNAEKIEAKAKDNADKRPNTLHEWQTMFEAIYPRDPQSYDQKSNFSHLIEELGEVSEAYRIRYFHPTALDNEIADVFTWIMGMANLINAHAKEGHIHGYTQYILQEPVFAKYSGRCSKCKQMPCSCVSKDGKIKISELNVVYSNEIIEAIKKSQTEISADIQNVFQSTDGKQFLTTLKALVDSADITESRVRQLVERLVTDPTNKKWYEENITASGIAESAVVSALTLLVQNMFH